MTGLMGDVLLILGGMLVAGPVGYLVGVTRRGRRERNYDAPIPVTPDYDETNPINGKCNHGQTVEMCGTTWYLR